MTRASTPAATSASAQSRGAEAGPPQESLRRGRARLGTDFVIGPRVVQGAVTHAYDRGQDDPVFRPLRIYALDPSASAADGAYAVLNVPYEPIETTPRGMRGAILEIVDDESIDEGGLGPLRLDDPFVLMRQGVSPSPESAMFRQQMTYAVCSTTYAAFRQALGREVSWGFRRHGEEGGSRLRIRPCIAHMQNAYYDPARGEVRFGTFEANSTVTGRNVPGGTVSLSLAHDVVVHEMSHALLDGLRSHFLYPSNLDVLAFHEGFSDLIAIFQRFTYRDVVGRALRTSRGKVVTSGLLTEIAVQFAQAMNATGSLRSAVSGDERRYEDTVEPHARGEILVAAVFDAFNRIYQRKAAPLLRLASNGTGVLPEGEIPELLAVQLTEKACRLASQFLAICIRAIDYCPPVDITFGEYLRAVITADLDLVPHDEWAYRDAWIDAFAKRRIYPAGVPSLSEGALTWRAPQKQVPPEPELSYGQLRFDGDPGRVAGVEEMIRQATAFGQLVADPAYCGEFGLAAKGDSRLGGDEVELPVVESVRSSRRVGPSGQIVFDLIAEVSQRRNVPASGEGPGFDFFGGATVVLDPRGRVRYVIRKSVLDDSRLAAQRQFIKQEGMTFFGLGPGDTRIPEAKLLLQLHGVTRPQLRSSAGTRALMSGMNDTAEAAAARQYLVMRGGKQPWVLLLKACLNQCLSLDPPLDDTDAYDDDTERAVVRLQTEQKASVDGIVGPATWTIIGKLLKHEVGALPLTADTPKWIVGLLKNDAASASLAGLRVDGVIDMVELSFGALSPAQRAGLGFILNALKGDRALVDLRWGAYMLATVKHECANTWQPIEEIGKGVGRPYGKPVSVVDEAGRQMQNVYYGRGFVQLTWRENYLAIGQAIGQGRTLEIHPEEALVPRLAYDVMSHGMRHGTFTGKALEKYIKPEGADYVTARRIINGTDRAELIASYAARFETLLQANIDPGPV
jgi:hypothetical protein